MLLGAALVFFAFPRYEDEKRMLAEFAAEDEPAAAKKEAPRSGAPVAGET